MINIDNLISEALKQKNPALDVYRLIKSEFLLWTKNNPNVPLTDDIQIKLLKKMCKQYKESEKLFREAGRQDLVDKTMLETSFVKALLPKETSPEEIEELTRKIIIEQYNSKVSMKDMKTILTLVQGTYPGASGEIVSTVVKSYVG